jgi:ligand-binding sensor domain-containing protein
MRDIVLTLFLLALCSTVPAQQAKQYSFKHFSVASGLASNSVNAVVQDRDGYIWMATTNGLQRYDGNSFLTFKSRQGDPSSIPNTSISQLYLDRKGRLWVMYDNNNVGIFDTKRFIYRKAQLSWDYYTIYLAQHLEELPTGEILLIKHNRSLMRYDELQNRFVDATRIVPYPAGWNPNEIKWDTHEKKYWLSCDSGLVQYDPATRHLNYRNHNQDNDPVIRSYGSLTGVVSLRIDASGNVFFYTWEPHASTSTISRYNRTLNKPEDTYLNIGYNEIAGFLLQRNGRVWIYGMPFFAEWGRVEDKFTFLKNEYKDEQSIKFDHATAAFEDRENNIWIATDNGMYIFNPEAQIFNSYNLIRPGDPSIDAPVTAVAEVSDGRLYVGCWGLGLFCFDKNFNPVEVPATFRPQYKYLSIWDMAVHSRTGLLWITQQGGHLDVFNPKTQKTDSWLPDVFKGSTIRQIDEDTSGNFWFGTQSGLLVKWDYKKSGGDYRKGYEVIYKTTRILKVHFDYQGYIWLATLGSGLIKIDVHTNRVVHIFTTQGPPGERIFTDSPDDMTYLNDSTLLVAAQCLNIINTKTNKVRFFSAEDGLPSNTAQSLQKDRNGILWIGMTDGLCRLNLKKKLISYFDRRDGIAYDKFATAGVEQLSDGNMIFYTDHNFLVFDPKRIAGKNLPPKPYITSFKLAGQPLSIDSLKDARTIVLKYNNTSIAIDFSALTYLQQQKIHYLYQLENIDRDWIHTDRPVEAIYNYLPPGEYVFKVKTENVDGLTGETIASIPITVRAPVWRTWWFYSLIALLVIAILYLLDRERMIKTRSLQQMRRQIRQNLRDEVSTTLNNINVLSEIAKIKADKNVEQSKDFIDQISDKSRYMMEAMDDMLWSIDPQNDSMKKNLLRIKEVTEGLRISYNASVDLIVDHKVQELPLDMKLRYELFFFYKESMNFILQNISCEQVFVNFNKVRSRLLVEILCECRDGESLKIKFRQAIDKRLQALPATMEVIADSKSFAVVLYVEVGK